MLTSTLPPNPKTDIIVAKGDSGASKDYLTEEELDLLLDITAYIDPKVVLPNNIEIGPTKKGQLPLFEHLSEKAKEGTVLPQLTNSSLVSLGQLCDDDFIVILTKQSFNAIKNKMTVLKGICNHSDGLWDIHIKKQQQCKNLPKPAKNLDHLLQEQIKTT